MQRTGYPGLPYAHGLGEALPIQLTIDTPFQSVGGKPTFKLIGAPPGATVYWSSYKDGAATGEFNSSYGQAVESNGTASLTGGEWTASDVGTWIKEVLVQDGDQNYRAVVQFRVGAAAPVGGAGTPVQAAGGNFLTDPLFTLGDFEIPGWLALVGGYVLGKSFGLFGKR